MTSGVREPILLLTVVSMATALTQEALKLQGEGLRQGSGFLVLSERIEWEFATGRLSGLFHSLLHRGSHEDRCQTAQSHVRHSHMPTHSQNYQQIQPVFAETLIASLTFPRLTGCAFTGAAF